jgi:hypothetical protein
MAPESKENKEFTRWFEQWVARLASNAAERHEASAQEASRKEEERPAPAERSKAAHAA